MKKIISIVITITMVVMLTACGGTNSPEATVKTFCEGMKKFDSKKISSTVAGSNEDAFAKIDENSTLKSLMKQLKEWASKMKYTIGKAEIDGDTAKVKVDFQYTDASAVMTVAMADYMSKALAMALSGASEDSVKTLLVSCLESAAKTTDTSIAEETVTLKLIKQDSSWKITDVPEELINVFTANIVGAITKAFGK